MEPLSDTSLGVTAEDFYESQKANRTGPVELGRRLADLVSPATFPPEQWQNGDPLVVLNQSVNAYAVNTLSSKMMLGAFPPGLPGWKSTPIEHKLDADIEQDPQLYSEVTYALSRRDEAHRNRLEATNCRTAITLYYKLLLLTGNALVLWTDIDTPIIHNMHNYVVKRDAGGTPIVVVLKESVSKMVADEDVVEAAEANRAQNHQTSTSIWDEEITIYHVQKLVNEGGKKRYVYWQEVEGGYVVPDTEAWTALDTPTMYAGGMIPVYGANWFLPYCIDYEGDMQAVENFSALGLPGGYHMRGESWQEAGAREFMEETGLWVDPESLTQVGPVVTDEYGNNLIVAQTRLPATQAAWDVDPEEVQAVVFLLEAPQAEAVAFPRHWQAMRDFFNRRQKKNG